MTELIEIKNKLHLMPDDEFKAWYLKYRLQVRQNAQQGIDWKLDEMQLFHQITHLQLICKTIRHAILNSPDDDFSQTFFDFFGDIRLTEMSNKGLSVTEITTENLH